VTRAAPEQASERLSRLLALVPWLVANDGVRIADAAARFGVSERQLLKDLDLLIVSGRPGHLHGDLVDIQYWDDDGRIHVLDPQVLHRPLALTGDEAAALLVSLRLLAQVPGDHDRAALVSATEKIEAATQMASTTVDIRLEPVPHALADRVREAIANGRRLQIRYASGATDSVTARVVDPMSLALVSGHLYLHAWCHSSEAMRTFRVDRILEADLADPIVDTASREQGAVKRGGPDLEALLRPSDRAITLRVHPTLAWLGEQPFAEILEVQPDGYRVIRVHAGSDEWLLRLLHRVGAKAAVVNDDALVAQVRSRALETLARYDEGE
jgi:predicted DNA-binding transcriptional regulator YafY